MDSSSTIVEFTRVYLAVFYSCVAVFYTVRITAMKRSGLAEVVFPGPPLCAGWWNHMVFRGFRIVIWLVCLLRWPFPELDDYLGIMTGLNNAPTVLAGNVLLTAGFLFTVAVHFELGRQWRSGVDPEGPDRLRTQGYYRFSRNPMFLGIATAQLGFFLALPSVFSALCLVVGLYILNRQVLVEESHLSARFGEDYAQFKKRVRRWL